MKENPHDPRILHLFGNIPTERSESMEELLQRGFDWDVFERLRQLSEDDSIYFFTLRALSNSGSFTNLHFFMNSTVYFEDSILWNTDIISIKDAPVRRRWFEVYDSNMVPLEK